MSTRDADLDDNATSDNSEDEGLMTIPMAAATAAPHNLILADAPPPSPIAPTTFALVTLKSAAAAIDGRGGEYPFDGAPEGTTIEAVMTVAFAQFGACAKISAQDAGPMKESEIAAFERAAGLCAFVRSTWNSAAPNRGTLHASIEPAAHVIDNSGSVLRRLLSCGACVRDAEVVTMCDVVISLGILLCEEISKMPITVPFDGLIKALDKYVTLRFHVSRDFWRAKHADKKRIEALQQKWHPLYFAVGALGTAPIPVASAGCAPRCAGREMDLDLIREVARALVFVPGKSADSWTPTICANRNARPDEIIKVDVSPLPSAATDSIVIPINVTVTTARASSESVSVEFTRDRSRWHAAAFVGTVEGFLKKNEEMRRKEVYDESQSPSARNIADACARRLASDYEHVVSVCCECDHPEFVLSVISAVSSCVSIVSAVPDADTEFLLTDLSVRYAAIAIAGAVADRLFWGTFGGGTLDFLTRAEMVKRGESDGEEDDAEGDGEPSGAADDDLTMSARVGGDTTDEEAASSARMPARPHENIRVEFAYRRKKPIDAGRDAARTWVTLVIAGVKRAIEVAIVAMARRGKSESAGYRESELDCVLLAARIASRAMEATADFSDRIRDGRLHLGLWTLRREMIVRGLVSKLVTSVAMQLHDFATVADVVESDVSHSYADFRQNPKRRKEEDDQQPDYWMEAFRKRYFAFGSGAHRRLAEHGQWTPPPIVTPAAPTDTTNVAPSVMQTDIPLTMDPELVDPTAVDPRAARADAGDPRVAYWSELRKTVFRTWSCGECDSSEWAAAKWSSWITFAAACLAPTRGVLSMIGKRVVPSAGRSRGAAPEAGEVAVGCGTDISDAATAIVFLAASAYASARCRIVDGFRVLSEAQLAWLQRIGDEDICGNFFCTATAGSGSDAADAERTAKRLQLTRPDGTPYPAALSQRILAATALTCGAWAAVVTREAHVGGSRTDRERSAEVMTPDEDEYGPMPLERDDSRECDDDDPEIPMQWNWMGSSDANFGSEMQADVMNPATPSAMAVACATLAFDLPTSPVEWRALQGMFAAALLGSSAIVTESEKMWTEQLARSGSVGRCHRGTASAGPYGIMALSRALEQEKLLFACRNAKMWMLTECDWPVLAGLSGIDPATILSLWNVLRSDEDQAERELAEAASAAASSNKESRRSAESSKKPGVISRLTGSLYAWYSSTREIQDSPTDLEYEDDDLSQDAAFMAMETTRGRADSSETVRPRNAHPPRFSSASAMQLLGRALRSVENLMGTTGYRGHHRQRRHIGDSMTKRVYSDANDVAEIVSSRATGAMRDFCWRIRKTEYPVELLNARVKPCSAASPGIPANAVTPIASIHVAWGACVSAMSMEMLCAAKRGSRDGATKIEFAHDEIARFAEVVKMCMEYHGASGASSATIRTVVAAAIARAKPMLPMLDWASSSLLEHNLGIMGFVQKSSLPIPFCTITEAKAFVGYARGIISDTAVDVLDVSVVCACLTEAIRSLPASEIESADVGCTIIADCIKSASADREATDLLALRGVYVQCMASRLRLKALACAGMVSSDRCAEVRTCVMYLMSAIKNVIDGFGERKGDAECQPSVVGKWLAAAAVDACTAFGAACETAIYATCVFTMAQHERAHATNRRYTNQQKLPPGFPDLRLFGRGARTKMVADIENNRDELRATEQARGAAEDAAATPTIDRDTAAAHSILEAIKILCPVLETFLRLPDVEVMMHPSMAIRAAIGACQIMLIPRLTSWPVRDVTPELRAELRAACVVDPLVRFGLCDVALAALNRDEAALPATDASVVQYAELKKLIRKLKPAPTPPPTIPPPSAQ